MVVLQRKDVEAAVDAHPEGATVTVRVVPRARRTEVVGRHGHSLKIKVAAPPVEGAANGALLAHLADLLAMRPAALDLLMGDRSRQKVVLVRGRAVAEVVDALMGDP